MHPREIAVAKARSTISDALLNAVVENNLTLAELVQLLANEISVAAVYMIREERHGDASKPGGLEKCDDDAKTGN